MRASSFEGKEVIDLNTGQRLGIIHRTDFLINTDTAKVEALLLMKLGFAGHEREISAIPWEKIRKISEDLVIVEN